MTGQQMCKKDPWSTLNFDQRTENKNSKRDRHFRFYIQIDYSIIQDQLELMQSIHIILNVCFNFLYNYLFRHSLINKHFKFDF